MMHLLRSKTKLQRYSTIVCSQSHIYDLLLAFHALASAYNIFYTTVTTKKFKILILNALHLAAIGYFKFSHIHYQLDCLKHFNSPPC